VYICWYIIHPVSASTLNIRFTAHKGGQRFSDALLRLADCARGIANVVEIE